MPACLTHDGRFKRGDEAIETAKFKLPTLSPTGFSASRWLEGCASESFSAANVETAIAFLEQCQPLKTPNLSSYALKHAAERWGRHHGMQAYVTNGELIAAAVYLDFKVKPSVIPNLLVAVSVKDVQRLDPTCIWSRWWRPDLAATTQLRDIEIFR
jgi:hypothetical protein